jgi:hypothetical protein
MSNFENDQTISVTIRTGTSTRAPIPRQNNYIENNFPQNRTISLQINHNLDSDSYRRILSLIQHMSDEHDDLDNQEHNFDTILSTSLYDNGLRRNPVVILDIDARQCKTGEIDGDCTVCQNKFKLGDKLSTLQACSHTFHYNCLQEWGKYKQECPLCRSQIPIIER